MRLDFMPVATEHQVFELEQAARHIWIDYYRNIFPPDQIEYMLQKFHSKEAVKKQIQNGIIHMILMFGNEDIGYISYYAEDDVLHLSKLCIKKEYRGKGLAKKVIEHFETIFLTKEHGFSHIKKIQHNVSVRNKTGITIYERLGFYKKKRVTVDFGNGYFSDDFIMERRIKPHEERIHGTKTETIHPFASDRT